MLVDELENMTGLPEENTDEMERLREIVEEFGGENKICMEELEVKNKDLCGKLGEQTEVITQREDEKEDLADEVEALRLDIKKMHRRQDRESIEISLSHAQMLEEREEREAMEDNLNSLSGGLAAARGD